MAEQRPHPSNRRSPIDGLTDMERALVKIRLANPNLSIEKCALKAGWTGKSIKTLAGRMLRRSQVRAALKNPSPELLGKKPPNGKTSPKWIKRRLKGIIEDVMTTVNDRLRALRQLAEMTEGAIVPVNINSKQQITIETLVEMMGGKPGDALNADDTAPVEVKH